MTERKHYLPTWATTDEACTWLEAQTGEAWPLARLLESWPMPSVWLEYSPDAPKELFGDRYEGIFTRLVWQGDKGHMMHTRTGLMTMTMLPNGLLCRFPTGIPFDLSELRYARDDLARLAQALEASQTGEQGEQSADDDSDLAAHFDPVKIAQLEAMFPAGGKWAKYAARDRSGLGKAARQGRGLYNPYHAARWWLTTGPENVTWEQCLRKLANNLDDRSRHLKGLLTGDFD